ncbi:MAG: hypothetical protein Q7V09_19400 [Hydrogenophaga sp.]|uniref:type IV pilus assembly protein FimV n=1 Tax=Hydrogenophaga sp. TaxID=1904254 RepID=UPI002728B4A4|nr:hypothetical protein [Hydrogenophaga sp.]MDO9032599.1 hypothetical protein [Hydrogenophaga sp.]
MRQILVGSILLSTVLSSQAVTLGRHSGAAVIGRGLDVRVQALVGPDEDASTLCIQAEVFFGDALVSPASVRTSTQRSAPDAETSVRIQTTQPVNEPVVTVLVRAGCTMPFSRRYVLLADPLSEPAVGAAPASTETGGSARATISSLPAVPRSGVGAPSASPAASAGGRGAETAPVAGPQAAGAAPLPRAAASRSRPPSVVRKPAVAAPQAAVPRLQLDPVDLSLSIERDPVLKLSLSLLSEPTTSEETRAAAGLLWKAINASPEEILRDAQKLSVLEAESKGLREQEARNKVALQAMEAQLEKARYMTWLAYLLGALLLLSLFAFLFARRRRGRQEDVPANAAWWAGTEKPGKSAAAAKAGSADRSDPSGLDIDFNLERESSFDGYRSLHDSGIDVNSLPAMADSDRREYPASQIGVSRSVATEELFDVQQQADFFVSLGEADKAIGVLKDHLMDSHEPSALAYLDLFKLYHQLNRRAEYDALRVEFNHLFNAGAPPFDQYSDDSQGLEAYETAFSRIQALWPQPRVLDVIEQSIFREANEVDGEVFDLEAYRELLLLHAIAKDMIKRDMVDSASQVDFQHTAIKPLKAAGNKGLAAAVAAASVEGRVTQPLDDIPPASPRLGLDVDLDALSEISAFEASLPEVPVPVEPTAKPAPPPNASVQEEGNLIDFEVLDFMPPDGEEDNPPAKKGR